MKDRKWSRCVVGLLSLLSVLLIACGEAATPTLAPPQPTSTPTSIPVPTAAPSPTAVLPQPPSAPTPTPMPVAAPSPTPTQQQPTITPLKWERIGVTGPAPGVRKDATLVYDDATNSLLLFGGRRGGQGLNDLWSFNLGTSQWKEIAASSAPSPRWGHVAMFDTKRRQMVLFSGQGPGGFFNDTWVFDTVTQQWKEVTPSGDKPSKRYGSCVGYDSDRDLIYISHGFTNSGRFNDTWAFDLNAQRWTDVSSSGVRPIERCLHRCAFDQGSSSFVLFGGQSNQTPILGDLWRYDPGSKMWTEIAPAGEKPSPRFFSSLVEDSNMRRFLLFGGVTSDGRKNDLWSYVQGERWTKLEASGTAPEARNSHAGAFVPSPSAFYIFGGISESELGDLWRLQAG